MKILCVIDSLGSGGAQRQLVELAIGFTKRGHQVSFLIYHDISFFKNSLDKADIPVSIIKEQNYFKRFFKIRNFIRQSKNDVIISFLQIPNFICELSSLPTRNWRLIVGERSADPGIAKSLKRSFFRWMHHLADHIVSNSEENIELVKMINPLSPKKKCHVIYNVIDFNKWYTPNIYDPMSSGKLRVVVAASHRHIKNAKGMIEAVNLLDALEKEKLRIDWYGEEFPNNALNDAERLVNKYKLNEIITFHPTTTNIVKAFSQSDIVGLFSLHEGLPNTICEGMALGRPILASRISDVPILINHDERFMFDPNNIVDIKQAFSRILSLKKDDLIKVGKTNREMALKLFNEDKLVSAYLTLFQNN